MTGTNIPQRNAHPIRHEAATHLFAVGQAVRLRSGFKGPFGVAGIYHITGTLPPTGNSPQYRIRSDDERHERVMAQNGLEPVLISAGESATLVEGTFGHGAEAKNRKSRAIRKPKRQTASPKPESPFPSLARLAATAPRRKGKT